MNINTSSESSPNSVPSETEMDEFESTNKVNLKPSAKNMLKLVKFGVIAVVAVFLVIVSVYALNMLNQSKSTQQVTVPSPSSIANATPSPTPQVQYPTEYINIQNKVDSYSDGITKPSEERVRLNPPAMNLSVSF